ncbi:MAG: hypothetical protein JW954_07240 [Dehalococcoidaceae bacterium]|nr:hypothetical protein [Dehalococcoidaceae bacterium]
MADSNKEIVEILKKIDAKLDEIKYDLKDVKSAMPKVPYYGDLLEDITRAVKELNLKR